MSGPRPPEATVPPDSAGPRLAGAVTALAVLGLLGCGPVEGPPSPEPEAPEGIERESWEVELELHGGASPVTVQAAYVADLEGRVTRADGGVAVAFLDSQGQPATRVRADRLFIDRGRDVVGFSGGVVAEAGGPGVTARSDTLAWDRAADRLSAGSAADLLLPDGRLRAGGLDGDSGLASWSATEVTGVFSGSEEGSAEGEDERSLHIEAAGAALEVRGGRVEADFHEARARWRDRRFQARSARYEGRGRRVVLEGAASMADTGRGRRLLAEAIDVDLEGSRFRAAGGVQVEGEAFLWADAVEEDGDLLRIHGDPARAEVDGRSLQARRLYVDGRTDTVTAAGEVSALEGDRRITADSLRLVRPRDQVEAFGSVSVAAADLEGDLRSARLRSGEGGVRLVMWGDPSLALRRPEGGDLVLRADSLLLDRSRQRLAGAGGFLLEAPPNLELRAGRGLYDTSGESVDLSGAVEFVHRSEAGASRLVSDSSRVELVEGEPVAITWPASLSGSLKGSGQTWLRAGSGRAALVSAGLSSLDLEGRVEALHRGASEERLSRFAAERMEMTFDEDGVLGRIVASGGAQVRLRLAAGGEEGGISLNDVEGERLRIDLAGGVVRRVHVLDGVEGRFEPAAGED